MASIQQVRLIRKVNATGPCITCMALPPNTFKHTNVHSHALPSTHGTYITFTRSTELWSNFRPSCTVVHVGRQSARAMKPPCSAAQHEASAPAASFAAHAISKAPGRGTGGSHALAAPVGSGRPAGTARSWLWQTRAPGGPGLAAASLALLSGRPRPYDWRAVHARALARVGLPARARRAGAAQREVCAALCGARGTSAHRGQRITNRRLHVPVSCVLSGRCKTLGGPHTSATTRAADVRMRQA